MNIAEIIKDPVFRPTCYHDLSEGHMKLGYINDNSKPAGPCSLGHNTWWQREDGGWVCQRCHPKPGTFTGEQICVDLVVVTKVYKEGLLVETRSAGRTR